MFEHEDGVLQRGKQLDYKLDESIAVGLGGGVLGQFRQVCSGEARDTFSNLWRGANLMRRIGRRFAHDRCAPGVRSGRRMRSAGCPE